MLKELNDAKHRHDLCIANIERSKDKYKFKFFILTIYSMAYLCLSDAHKYLLFFLFFNIRFCYMFALSIFR